MGDSSEGVKKNENPKLNSRSTLKKLTIDRFVLAHFFLLFFVSFIIGVIFLHSTITLWQWQTSEDSVLKALESITNGIGWRDDTSIYQNRNTVSISLHDNMTLTTSVT